MLRLILFVCLILSGAQVDAHAQEGRLATIIGTKTIKLAYRTDAMPFSYVNAFNDPTGYSIDLCRLAVEIMQHRLKLDALKIEWMPATTQNRFDLVAQGKADVECGASTMTLKRLEQVDFSSAIFVESTGILVKKDGGITTAKDLDGKKIAVTSGTTNEAAIKSAFGSSQATIVSVDNREQGIGLLQSGRADAFASDKLLLVGAALQSSLALTILPDDFSLERYALVLPRGESDLRLAVNTALADIFQTGEAFKIYDKWFGKNGLQRSPLLTAVYMLGAIPE